MFQNVPQGVAGRWLRDKGNEYSKKGEILYWILIGSDGPYIEAYGKLVNRDTVVRIDPKEHSVGEN